MLWQDADANLAGCNITLERESGEREQPRNDSELTITSTWQGNLSDQILSNTSDYWRGFATFGPVPILSKGRFTSISVAIPSSLEEQQDIAKPLVALEAKVEVAEKKVISLQALFHTLLHELMTAKTRVHALDIKSSHLARLV